MGDAIKSKRPNNGGSTRPDYKKNKMEKIISIKILRPITLPIIGMFVIIYIIIDYVFDLEM